MRNSYQLKKRNTVKLTQAGDKIHRTSRSHDWRKPDSRDFHGFAEKLFKKRLSYRFPALPRPRCLHTPPALE